MGFFEYLINPSKRVKKILKPRNPDDDITFLVKEKIEEIKNQKNYQLSKKTKLVTHNIVFVSFLFYHVFLYLVAYLLIFFSKLNLIF